MAKPCCCLSLRTGVTIFAWVDVVLNSGFFGFSVVLLLTVLSINPDDYGDDFTKEDQINALVACVSSVAISVSQIFLALYLRKAAHNRNLRACRIWCIITVIVFIVSLVGMLLFAFSTTPNITTMGSGILGVLYKAYELLLVVSFIRQIKEEIATDSGRMEKLVEAV